MLSDDDIKKIDKLIKKRIQPLDKKLDVVISYFDRVTTDHEARLRTVEHHLSSTLE